jgi:hypothetical protein
MRELQAAVDLSTYALPNFGANSAGVAVWRLRAHRGAVLLSPTIWGAEHCSAQCLGSYYLATRSTEKRARRVPQRQRGRSRSPVRATASKPFPRACGAALRRAARARGSGRPSSGWRSRPRCMGGPGASADPTPLVGETRHRGARYLSSAGRPGLVFDSGPWRHASTPSIRTCSTSSPLRSFVLSHCWIA